MNVTPKKPTRYLSLDLTAEEKRLIEQTAERYNTSQKALVLSLVRAFAAFDPYASLSPQDRERLLSGPRNRELVGLSDTELEQIFRDALRTF